MVVAATNCRRDSFRDICSLPELICLLVGVGSGLHQDCAERTREYRDCLKRQNLIVCSHFYCGIQRSKSYWRKRWISTAPLSQCRIALSSSLSEPTHLLNCWL